MGMFNDMMSRIFRNAAPAERPSDASVAQPSPASQPVAPAAVSTAVATNVDVEAILTRMASENQEKLDWKRSIVDLMKLIDMDSSLAARKELASDLKYPGNMANSTSMNIWLHGEVMRKLAANGGNVPADLLAR